MEVGGRGGEAKRGREARTEGIKEESCERVGRGRVRERRGG